MTAAKHAAPVGSAGDRILQSPSPSERAVELTIRGIVQGVGFRPFVHRMAIRHHLSGWVRNESGAVRVVAQGMPADVDAFLAALAVELPPLARIDELVAKNVDPAPLEGFRVVASDLAPVGRLPVSPDVAMCDACERELHDPANRRYRYPFITCTDCGPRFTVIEEMPYDRERSTMKVFAQCPECLREYADPADRRYHSETNSCPVCGPQVWLEVGGRGEVARGYDAIVEAGRMLVQGSALAVRGLGGFHLAVDARNSEAVRRLRERKGREAKPLALMVRSLNEARQLARVSGREAAALTSRERPIVVLARRRDSPLAPEIAPDLDSVGVMLAYTPLHQLLLDAAEGRPLVMTSGNVSEEPIAIGNDEARTRLAEIADGFLLHDREICSRYDDSVVRIVDDDVVFLRRSRGFAPVPLRLPVRARETILGIGPHLKNTFTIAAGDQAYVSQHIGDLDNFETVLHAQEGLARFRSLFRLQPRWIVRDLHPGYLSTRIAEDSGLPQLPPVQHHHAHVAAVMAEHGVTERTLGISFDGTGYGSDGHVWGCELLDADLRGFERVAHMRYAPMPGGDLAARAPWRAFLGFASLDDWGGAWAATVMDRVPAEELRVARQQIRRGVNAPLESSMGRLFDAAAALLGLRIESAYEAQAAMELEAVAARGPWHPLPFPALRSAGNLPALDPLPLLHALAAERLGGAGVPELAARFHESVACGTAELAWTLCRERGLGRVALSGGCFQNALLLRSLRHRLEEKGFEVLTPIALGPNDGAISYGQVVVAAARLSDEGGRNVSRNTR